MPKVRLIPYRDFTGGLNLRADAFQLGENESPDMLNVEVDPRGGFTMRKSWEDWEALAPTNWDPRNMHAHVNGDGTETMFLANDGEVWIREQGGSFAVKTGTFSADPHEASFASWKNDVYVAAGLNVSHRYKGSDNSWASLTDPSPGAGTWSDDPLAPTSNQMPIAQHVTTHDGRLWIANTYEDSVAYEHRVRFSWPNVPDSWSSLDYIDIPEGGGPITGIVSMRDHLLVFFPSKVFAIYGYDLQSFSKAEVSASVGAVNSQCIARSETAAFFVSWPEGVYMIDQDSVDEVSARLRPAIESTGWSTNTDAMWLSWANQRLYWSVPYNKEAVPSDADCVFVFDPQLGSWTKHRTAGGALAPIVDSAEQLRPVGCCRDVKQILEMGVAATGKDIVQTVPTNIVAHFRTRWMTGGFDTIKKRWRRPDVVVKQADVNYDLLLYIYHDYDEANAKRTKTIVVNTEGEGGLWYADPEWDGTDASLTTPPVEAPIWSETPDPDEAGWGLAAEGSQVERGGSLGSARSIQMVVQAAPGQHFGVNEIVFKYILRRIK